MIGSDLDGADPESRVVSSLRPYQQLPEQSEGAAPVSSEFRHPDSGTFRIRLRSPSTKRPWRSRWSTCPYRGRAGRRRRSWSRPCACSWEVGAAGGHGLPPTDGGQREAGPPSDEAAQSLRRVRYARQPDPGSYVPCCAFDGAKSSGAPGGTGGSRLTLAWNSLRSRLKWVTVHECM